MHKHSDIEGSPLVQAAQLEVVDGDGAAMASAREVGGDGGAMTEVA